MGRRIGFACSAIAFVALVARATGCTSSNDSGPADCVAAGGQCQIPNLQCATVGPQDCNPDRTTAGTYCCLAETDAAIGQNPVDEAATDAAPCTDVDIAASNYDQSCTTNSDCVAVGVGNACFACEIGCANSAIGKSALAKYRSDVAKTPANGADCGCPASLPGPCCIQGMCQLSEQCATPLPGTDASPDTGTDDGATDAEACAPSGCTGSCLAGRHNVSSVIDGCTVWQCCVPDDGGAPASDATGE